MPPRATRAERRGVALPLLVLSAAVVVVVSLSFIFAYREVDRLAEIRQAKTFTSAIAQQGHGLARELQLETIWAEAFRNTAIAPDAKWLNTYGSYLSALLGYDEVYILDAADRPFYGYEDRTSSQGAAFEEDRSDVADLIASVRAGGNAAKAHVAITRVDLGNGHSVEHRSVSDVRLVAGKPVNVVVQTIVPEVDPGPIAAMSAPPPLLVVIFALDGRFLNTFGRDFDYSGLRWVQLGGEPAGGSVRIGSNELSTPVLSSNGVLVGIAAWTKDLPGQELLGRMSAGLGIACLLLIGIGLIAFRTIRAHTRGVEDRERREALLARTDHLTGLANRLALSEETANLLAALEADRVMGVLTIDLDGFKRINDTMGHQAGDAALIAVGGRLRDTVADCFVARTGGDEFVVLAPREEAEDVAMLAGRLVSALCAPLQLASGENVKLGCSIGYAIAPQHGRDELDLFRRSDLALLRAKSGGRGRAQGFDAALEAKVIRRSTVEAALRRAIEGGRIKVAYQPLMAPDGVEVRGVEALARWDDPDLGVISPAEFIPIAEDTGLIVELGEQVLHRALIDAAAWPSLTVSVNVSAQQIHRGNVAETVERQLSACNFPAGRLEIELTESSLVADAGRADAQITALQRLGIKVALDDFGTGYASLLYLRQFGFDKLKIDKQFVHDSDTSVEARAMVISITSMCSTLGLEVTAEGVENSEQLRFLQIAGCGRMQGFLFSRPIWADDLTQFLVRGRAAA